MSTKPVSIGSLKKGNYVVVDGVACTVVDSVHAKSGKHGSAKVRLTAVGLIDNKKRLIVMPSGDSIDTPIIDKRNAQVLSVSGEHANVMDTDSFETFDLAVPKELQGNVNEGNIVVYWNIMGDKVMKQIKS